MLLGQNSRNKLINAQFDLWQRGTSFALNAQAYTADRTVMTFNADGGTVATGTISRQLNTSSLSDQPYLLRITNTSVGSSLGVNSYHIIGQRVENVRTFSGKKVTISVWASSTIANKQLTIYAHQYFGSGGSSQVNITGTVVTLTSSIQRYDFTFTVPSVDGKTIGSGDYFFVGLGLQFGSTTASGYSVPAVAWGGTGNVDILRWQVNEGPAADFELAGGGSPSVELMLCQRYYEKSYALNVNPGTQTRYGCVVSGLNSYNRYDLFVPFAVMKRAGPTVSIYATDTGNVGQMTSGQSGGSPDTTASPYLSVERGYTYAAPVSGNLTTTGFGTSQVFLWQWTADAEL